MVSRAERATRTAELVQDLAHVTDLTARQELIDEIIVLNRPVAEAVASRYRGRGIAAEDLTQVAYEGLVKAAHRFDPASGNDFLTYAVPTIRGEVRRYFRDLGWTVRPPRRVQELQYRMNKIIDDAWAEQGRDLTPSELQTALGIDHDEYAEVMQAFGAFTPTSLDMPVGSEEGTQHTLVEMLPGDPGIELGAAFELAPLVRRLPQRDRRILKMRFFDDRTQSEIGAEIGVTQMQVSRLLSRILTDLREQMQDQSADD